MSQIEVDEQRQYAAVTAELDIEQLPGLFYVRTIPDLVKATQELMVQVDEVLAKNPGVGMRPPPKQLAITIKAYQKLEKIIPEYEASIAPRISDLSISNTLTVKDALRMSLSAISDSLIKLCGSDTDPFGKEPTKFKLIKLVEDLLEDVIAKQDANPDGNLPLIRKSTMTASPLLQRASSTSQRGRISIISLGTSRLSNGTAQCQSSDVSASKLVSSCLFGDPNMPIAKVAPLTKSEQTRAFNLGEPSEQMTRLYATFTAEKMKVFLHATRRRVFDIDLGKWSEHKIVYVIDSRDDFMATEVMEIRRDTLAENEFIISADTAMRSNKQPIGSAVIESNFKISIYSQVGGTKSEKPAFSITGDFALGRFMVIARDNVSREQKNVGNSSGWVAKKKMLGFSRDVVRECNLEIQEILFNKIVPTQSPLVMAVIALALAPRS
ncbi:hypothetical protein BC830DRAFT_1083606 [Chytriomyces sp. MP71]|nr:hypothetical protein BC830DRAFT_1083606 [Chytriomyces sp. MP71]